MRETELFFRCVRQNYFLAYKSSIVLSEFQDYTFRQPLQVYPKLMMVKFTSSLPMHYNLQVYGLISQNGFFYSNGASSPRKILVSNLSSIGQTIWIHAEIPYILAYISYYVSF